MISEAVQAFGEAVPTIGEAVPKVSEVLKFAGLVDIDVNICDFD
jgi:hypothetical protein